MTWTLRPYQQDSVNATVRHFRKTNAPAVIVLPTGAGKSLVVAELARIAKQKILVLTHVKELVEQNYLKYCALGLEASVYSAGLKRKDNHHQVTFASIQSVCRNLEQFDMHFSLVIIDECHRVAVDDDKPVLTPSTDKHPSQEIDTAKKGHKKSQYIQLLDHLKQKNPALKILGLTATPYRLGQGWIYKHHYHGFSRNSDVENSLAFFEKCIFELPLRWMVKHKFLTPIKLVDAVVAQYDFSELPMSVSDHFNAEEVNRILEDQNRITFSITQQIETLAKDRQGVMIFAATVAHAQEIMGYLPKGSAALIVGDTAHDERDERIQQFKQKQLKFIVNVSVLTTGFDAPHVDMIAILRPTQSVSLFQQIVGRGMRLAGHKKDCWVLDYAANGFDLYQPDPGQVRPDSDSEPVQVFCPSCGFANMFWGKVDANGNMLEHYGRKCQGVFESDEVGEEGDVQACDYRFVFRECEACGHENDIAARKCQKCLAVMVDPDEQLRKILALKKHMVIRCAHMQFTPMNGKYKISYFDEDGLELSEWLNLDYKSNREWFNKEFTPRIKAAQAPRVFESNEQLAPWIDQLVKPDFVVGKPKDKGKPKNNKEGASKSCVKENTKKTSFHAMPSFTIIKRIFDYEGRYRKADTL